MSGPNDWARFRGRALSCSLQSAKQSFGRERKRADRVSAEHGRVTDRDRRGGRQL